MNPHISEIREYLTRELELETVKFNTSLMRCKELERQIENLNMVLKDKGEGEG